MYSNQQSGNPTFSLHKEITSSEVTYEIHDSEGCKFLSEELPDIDSFNDIHPHFDDNPLSGSITYSSNSLLEEFTDELALITYPSDYDDNLTCDIESDLREIEFLLYQDEDSDLKDSIDQTNLANFDAFFVDPTPEMFDDEHALDYSFPPRFDVYPDDFLEIKSDADNFYDDPFDSKGEKIKESELLIDEPDLPCDFLPYPEYDSFASQNFSRDDDLPSPDKEDKVKENQEKDKIRSKPEKNEKRAIVVPPILAEQFELKHSLINMMTLEQFFGLEKDNPYDHIRCKNSMNLFMRHGKDIKISFVHVLITALLNLHQLDTFYNALNPADQDSLNAAAGGNLLEKSPQDALTIIENKSKVLNSRSKPIASSVNACDINSSSEIAKLTHAVNQQTSVVTTAMMAMLKQLQANPPPAQVKAVEEICVICRGAHPYYQCLAAGGNTFPEFRDNIQGYVSAAAGNYNQGNLGYRPQGVANQMRPPDFAQPNVQNNQNRFGQPLTKNNPTKPQPNLTRIFI
nr:hypothetical protein [Tanacetum cinerariifolium]